jgi:hypothetical protein
MLLRLRTLCLLSLQVSVAQVLMYCGAFIITRKTKLKLKLKLIYDRQSVGQSVLVSGAHLGPATNFSFSLKFLLDSCGFIIL